MKSNEWDCETPSSIRFNLKAMISFTLFVLAATSPVTAGAQSNGASNAPPPPPPPPTNLDRLDVWGFRIGIFNSFVGGLNGASEPRDASSTSQGLWAGQNTYPSAGTPDDPTTTCDTLVANPINVATANKIEKEVDYESIGGEMPLRFERTYNHNVRRAVSIMPNWITNFDYSLNDGGPDGFGGGLFYSLRPDGTKLDFYETAPGSNLWASTAAGSNTYIVKEADGTFSLHNAETGQVETYGLPLLDQLGGVTRDYKIVGLKNKSGIGWTFSYGGNLPDSLTQVTHTNGKAINIVNTPGSGMTMTAPGGETYSYVYSYYEDPNYGGATSVSKATLPEGTVIDYFYAPFSDAKIQLLGKSFNGVRYSTFTWSSVPGNVIDNDGIIFSAPWAVPIASEHAGGVEKSTFDYQIVPYGGEVTQVVETSPLGRVSTYKFSGGKLAEITGTASPTCLGSITSWTYDEFGYKDKITDKNGFITDFDYDTAGRLQKKVEALNQPEARTTTYAWDNTNSLPLSETIEGMRKSEFTYTTDNRIQTSTITNLSPNGVANEQRTTSYAYSKHPNGVLAQMVIDGPLAGNGDATTYTYDLLGNLATFTNSLGHTASYSNYNARGLVGRFVGVNGGTTEFSYDGRGRLTNVYDYYAGAISHTQYIYSPSGLLDRVIYGDGRVHHYVYDDARRLMSEYETVATGDGGRIQYTRNNASDVTQTDIYSIDSSNNNVALLRRETVDYDELSRVVGVRGNHGQNVRYEYDRMGNVTKMTDSNSRDSFNSYDALNRLTSTNAPASGTVSYQYDDADQLEKVVDSRNLQTTFSFDGFGSLWRLESPDSGITAFTYNASGQQLTMTRANGVTLNYQYDDVLGRLTRMGNAAYARKFEYDSCSLGKGLVCSGSTETLSGVATKVAFGYTDHGDLEFKHEIGSGANYITLYQYNPERRLVGIAYPTGVNVGYTYSFGRMTGMSATAGGVTTNLVSNANYQPFGANTGFTYGNGLDRRINIDSDGRVTGLSAAAPGFVRQSLTYGYNVDDLISAQTNGIDVASSHTYNYDGGNRLNFDSLGGNPVASVDSFDTAGNRVARGTSEPGAPPSSSYVISTTSNQVMSQSGNVSNSFLYNPQGNRKSSTGWQGNRTYQYDDFDRLESVSINGASSSYTVNAFDQRVKKNVGQSGSSLGIDTYYVFGGQNTLLAHSTATGAWRSYLWFGDQLVGIVRPDNVLLYVHTDHLGRPEIATNAAAQQVWRSSNGSYHGVANTPGVVITGFPGQIWDEDTATWYNGFRDYDPFLGRYLQTDPLGVAGGINTYAYADSNPVNKTDPMGLSAVAIGSVPWYTTLPQAGAIAGRPFVLNPVGALVGGLLYSPGDAPSCETSSNFSACISRVYSDSHKPDNCPTGTLPIDKAKGKFGFGKDGLHKIKEGVGAGPETWTGIAPNEHVWTGGPGGVGTDHGPFGDYLPGGRP